jgi:hypothetical protein
MMSISIPAWIAVPAILGGRVNAAEAVPFLVICAAGVSLCVWFGRSLRETSRAGL